MRRSPLAGSAVNRSRELARAGRDARRDTPRVLGLKKGSVDRALAGLVGKAEARRTASGPELTDPLLEHWPLNAACSESLG